MSDEQVEIVRTLLEMFKRRENETPFAFYAEDIVWDVSAFGAVGAGGIYEGHEGVRTFWRRWLEAWKDIEWDYEMAVRGDDIVALVTNQRNQGRGSGLWVDQEPYEIAFTFRGNQVARVKLQPVSGDSPAAATDAS